MRNKIKVFLEIKANWVTIITVILATVGLIIGLFFQRFTYQVISGMFLLIAVENFVAKIIYMDEIKRRLDTLTPPEASTMVLKNFHQCKLNSQLATQAKEELFYVGIHLRHYFGDFDFLISRSDIKIRLIILDPTDFTLLNSYMDMRGYDSSAYDSSTQHLKKLKKCSHI